jgi:hypothetical protein
MGDYRNHQKETGRFLCNSYDDVVKSGRETKEEKDREDLRAELAKVEFYSTRYLNHFNSVKFGLSKRK